MLISGLTVVVAMAGMFLAGDTTFSAVAEATILVVLVAVAGSVSVLPALLSLLGDRVDRGRIRSRRRGRPRPGRGVRQRTVGRVRGRVLRRPIRSATIAVLVLLALAVPALGMRTASPGSHRHPGEPAHHADVRPHPAGVPGRCRAGEDRRPGARRDRAEGDGSAENPAITGACQRSGAGAVHGARSTPAHTVAVASVGLIGNGTDSASIHALNTLRHDIVPAAFAGSGASSWSA